jgi:hypothetical protein
MADMLELMKSKKPLVEGMEPLTLMKMNCWKLNWKLCGNGR